MPECFQKSGEVFEAPEIGVMNACKPQYRCGESNPGPLQEYPVLLTEGPISDNFLKKQVLC